MVCTFATPFADSSPHPPVCRYGRPETASRDPIRASVSDFWLAPALSSRRNWCLEVVRFVCSSSSALTPPYFPNVYPSIDRTRIYSLRGMRKGGRDGEEVKNVALENHLYDPPTPRQAIWTIHFAARLFFAATSELSRSFLSVLDAIFDLQPRVWAREPLAVALPPVFSRKLILFTAYTSRASLSQWWIHVYAAFVVLRAPPLCDSDYLAQWTRLLSVESISANVPRLSLLPHHLLSNIWINISFDSRIS